jgi:Protein kinase domain
LLAEHIGARYVVEREIGAGGMATVYLAHDAKHDRDVAIKVLHPELGAVLGADRFLSEIRTTARLQHPHILPLLDSGDAGGLLYYGRLLCRLRDQYRGAGFLLALRRDYRGDWSAGPVPGAIAAGGAAAPGGVRRSTTSV